MRPLFGPSSDLDNIRRVLVSSSDTALFNEHQFVELRDPTSEELRSHIGSYILGRSAPGDILVFYFSGHGVSVGSSDFGFCTIDTMIHPGSNTVLPLTVLTFSDLLETLAVMGVIPLFIIDACYSGAVGNAVVSSSDAINNIHQGIRKSVASNYALLCSCAQFQSSLDTPQGGVFSQILFKILSSGLSNLRRDSNLIGIVDIYRPINSIIEQNAFDSVPRLYLGETFPDFPIAKNILFSPQSYSFVGHLKCIVDALWNNGDERELSPSEILKLCGQGAYGNHQKLSLEPWMLVENSNGSKRRRLTERGRLFAQGRLEIPRTIEKEPATDKWISASNSIMVNIGMV